MLSGDHDAVAFHVITVRLVAIFRWYWGEPFACIRLAYACQIVRNDQALILAVRVEPTHLRPKPNSGT